MNTSYPLLRLPHKLEQTLYLIGEELKITRFFNELEKVGFVDSPLQPHLSKLILAQMGLDDGEDETIDFFTDVIDRRSKKIGEDDASLMKQVMKTYAELEAYRTNKKITA